MCCDDLVCARCAGPVAEARCPACRSARDQMHHSTFTLSPQAVVLVVTVLVLLCLIAAQRV
ncbi:MAG: hypothetical protein ACQSGP_15880 [Frankia sp.]